MENNLIGIGAGPANLSLAALLTTARDRGLISLRSTFFEKNQAIFWHSGQMFPGTLMQIEFYRDLVTPIDPTSRFSFLNYIKLNGRLDQFFCSSTIYPTRREFEDYFNWVANQIAEIFSRRMFIRSIIIQRQTYLSSKSKTRASRRGAINRSTLFWGVAPGQNPRARGATQAGWSMSQRCSDSIFQIH